MAPRADILDQAAGLRRLLGTDGVRLRSVAFLGPDPALTATACASLAFALVQRGGDVCVLDECAGPHTVAGQFGITPRAGLAEVVSGEIGLNSAIIRGAGGIGLLPAEGGMALAAASDQRQWSELADTFAQTPWQWILLPAGGDEPGFALTATRRVLVLPPGRQRLTEAYAIMKGVQRRQADAAWQVLVMQTADDGQAARLAAAIGETARRFLGIEASLLGGIPRDGRLEAATRAMRPLLDFAPEAPAAGAFRAVAETMSGWPPDVDSIDARVFWQRLGLFSRMHAAVSRPSHWRPRHGRASG